MRVTFWSHNCSADVSCARAQRSDNTDGMKSVPPWQEKVSPFTIGGWPVDGLCQGTMKLLRKIADQDGRTIEEVMTTAMEEFVVKREAEKEVKAKIIRFPKS